ncbi:hypothetical protein ACJJTC_013380 [Scirpophaga incertulas]
MSIAQPYIVHERLWHRQQHMLEMQRRSMMGEIGGFGHYPTAYVGMPPPPLSNVLAFPDEFEPRDLRSNRGSQPMAVAPSLVELDRQPIHHHLHHYLQMHPPHVHISIQPTVMVRRSPNLRCR